MRETSDIKTDRIVKLLRTTELSMVAIAERMGVSPMTVHNINDQHQIRDYQGKRLTFILNSNDQSNNQSFSNDARW